MTRKTRGAAVALILMLASAPSAMAADPTGGTAARSTTTTAPTAPAPADGSTPSATPAAPATAVSPTQTVKLTRSQTKQVQRRVRVRADGSLGSRTRTAIRRYQGTKRLTRTGRPNLETIKAMKLSFASQVERKLATGTDAGTGTTDRQAPVSGDVAAAIAAARTAIGTPYQSGGTTTSGFDCSGLMVWAFEQAGAKLPRTSFEQYEVGTPVEQAAIQPGDLVFFSTAGPGASHVGIATSATTVISATTKGVMEHQLDDDYWGAAYVGARRVAAS